MASAIETAKTGQEVIEKSNLTSYNLAIIDLRLPDTSGADLLTAMRETTPRMVKIMLTGNPSTGDRTEIIKESADDYLVKPVEIENLLRILKNHLEKEEDIVDCASTAT